MIEPERQLTTQLSAARKLLEGSPKAKLVLSRLDEKPEGLNGAKKAFEVSPNGDLLRLCFEHKNRWSEVMPQGVTPSQRHALLEVLGFNPQNSTRHEINAGAAYLRQQIYYTENEQKGGD